MMQMHTILYTTDFSDSSKAAFPLAYSLARDHGAPDRLARAPSRDV